MLWDWTSSRILSAILNSFFSTFEWDLWTTCMTFKNIISVCFYWFCQFYSKTPCVLILDKLQEALFALLEWSFLCSSGFFKFFVTLNHLLVKNWKQKTPIMKPWNDLFWSITSLASSRNLLQVYERDLEQNLKSLILPLVKNVIIKIRLCTCVLTFYVKLFYLLPTK